VKRDYEESMMHLNAAINGENGIIFMGKAEGTALAEGAGLVRKGESH
jgi:hypothetical protein